MLVLISFATIPSFAQLRQRAAEDEISTAINKSRAAAGLPPLKRASSSEEELQLTCTAAVTGKDVYEPKFGAFVTYETDDLKSITEGFKLVAFGTTQYLGVKSRTPIYTDKDWPRYTVTVFIEQRTGTERPTYRVGLGRKQSQMNEFLSSLTFDHPIKDRTDWKEQVAPECKKVRS